MGLTLSNLFSRLFSKKQLRILMLGLDGAGKTTILYQLKFSQAVTTIPTVGFNVELVEFKNIQFAVWDVGGQDKLRRLWRHYYQNTQGIVFVIDSSDRDRIDEARNELQTLLREQELDKACLLVLANKQDLPISMTAAEIEKKLQLDEMMRSRRTNKWYIQSICAVKGHGLYEGFEWLSNQLAS